MSFARRYGAEGLRRGSRVPGGKEVLPWDGFTANMVLALDAKIGVSIETGVSGWEDQSDEGNDFSQSNTSFQPALSTFNGHASIEFTSASAHRLQRVSDGFTGMAAGASGTVFVVGKFDATSNSGLISVCPSESLREGLLLFQEGGSMKLRGRNNTTTQQATYAFSDTTDAHVFEGIHATASRTIIEDGTSQDVNNNSVSISQGDNGIIGALFNGATPIYQFDGHIHSVLMFNVVLSSGDRSTIRSRLGSRWGVTVV